MCSAPQGRAAEADASAARKAFLLGSHCSSSHLPIRIVTPGTGFLKVSLRTGFKPSLAPSSCSLPALAQLLARHRRMVLGWQHRRGHALLLSPRCCRPGEHISPIQHFCSSIFPHLWYHSKDLSGYIRGKSVIPRRD